MTKFVTFEDLMEAEGFAQKSVADIKDSEAGKYVEDEEAQTEDPMPLQPEEDEQESELAPELMDDDSMEDIEGDEQTAELPPENSAEDPETPPPLEGEGEPVDDGTDEVQDQGEGDTEIVDDIADGQDGNVDPDELKDENTTPDFGAFFNAEQPDPEKFVDTEVIMAKADSEKDGLSEILKHAIDRSSESMDYPLIDALDGLVVKQASKAITKAYELISQIDPESVGGLTAKNVQDSVKKIRGIVVSYLDENEFEELNNDESNLLIIKSVDYIKSLFDLPKTKSDYKWDDIKGFSSIALSVAKKLSGSTDFDSDKVKNSILTSLKELSKEKE